jgi:hypothetical protein
MPRPSQTQNSKFKTRFAVPYWERWLRELPTIESVAGASSKNCPDERGRGNQRAGVFLSAFKTIRG